MSDGVSEAWVLAGNFVDSGLRYEDAGSCYAEAQNTGMEMREIGMSPKFYMCSLSKGLQVNVQVRIPAAPRSSFPFNYGKALVNQSSSLEKETGY